MADEVINLADSDDDEDVSPKKLPSTTNHEESIDLCDSSDDEENEQHDATKTLPPPPPPPRPADPLVAAASLKKKKSTAAAAAAETSIDLCDSSDNETRKENSKSKASVKASRAKSWGGYDLSDDEDDDELLKGGRIFAEKPAAKRWSFDNTGIDVGKQQKCPPSVATVARKPKEATTTCTTSLDMMLDDSDDDDDLLLSYKCPLTITTPRRSFNNKEDQQKPSSSKTPDSTRPTSTSTPAAPIIAEPFPYPTLLSTSKKYLDERARYALAFWKYARGSLTRHSYQRPKLDSVAKRVVRLAVSEYPVRSLEEYICFGKTSVNNARQVREEHRQELDQGSINTIRTPVTSPCPGRKYYTITEACLVTLLMEVESRQKEKGVELIRMSNEVRAELLKQKDMWVSLEDLIPAIDSRLLPQCPGKLSRPDAEAHYTEQSTRSIEFLQISKLECNLGGGDDVGPRIKRHVKGGKVHFELLPAGCNTAIMIRDRPFPAPPGHYRCSKITTLSQVEEQYRGICLAQDLREGGGGGNVLHLLCNKLDMQKVPYFVGSLSIGDYAFFTSKDGGGKTMDFLCPVIVERKAVQDVAMSIHDGRWKNQKRRMYHAQYVFGYDNCSMVFIIEGNENAQTVSGGYVGARWYNVDKEKLNEEIKNLKEEGFEVMRTPSKENTMFELARWARRIASEIKTGAMKPQFTYSEFKKKVAEIKPETDFSRLAKYHMRQKLAREEAAKRAAASDGSDSDIEVLPNDATTCRGSDKPSSTKKPPKKKQRSTKEEEEADDDEYSGLSTKELKAACEEVGLPKSGKRTDLIARLKGPHPPKLWLTRKQKGEYVPTRHDTGATALLVALYLHEKAVGPEQVGLTKDELYVKAEELNISKNPFSGGTTQTGPYHYDGWSNMKSLMNGDPALVIQKRGKYKLTRSCDISGYPIAEAMHRWCHQHNNCPCGETGF